MKQLRDVLRRTGIYLFTIVFIYAACLSVFEVTIAQGISGGPSKPQPVGQAGTSLDVICPLSQGFYDQWMPMPLDGKQSFFIRIESTQNRSIAAESGPVTILPRQSQPGDQRQGISPGR